MSDTGADTKQGEVSLFSPDQEGTLQTDAPGGTQEGHKVIPLGKENGPEGLANVLTKPTISVVQGVEDTEMYKPPPMTDAERQEITERKRALATARRTGGAPTLQSRARTRQKNL